MSKAEEVAGPSVRPEMVLFFLVDTSGSMAGSKIGAVNTAIKEVLPELKTVGGADVDLKIACLKFSTGCEWMDSSGPVPVENFVWKQLDADGVTDLGAMCRELEAKLHQHGGFLNAPHGSKAPVLFLLSDGEPTDNFESGLDVLQKNNWFKNAVKAAVAIGDDANEEILAKFTGNKELVLSSHSPQALMSMIKFVSITSTMIGSGNEGLDSTGQPRSKRDDVADAFKAKRQNDPDWDNMPKEW